jgi:hypothetical protein
MFSVKYFTPLLKIPGGEWGGAMAAGVTAVSRHGSLEAEGWGATLGAWTSVKTTNHAEAEREA